MNIRKANIKDFDTIISLKIKIFKNAKLEYLLADWHSHDFI